MSKEISYRDFFTLLNVGVTIFIEDEFIYDLRSDNKNAIIYDFLRLNKDDKRSILKELGELNKDLVEKLTFIDDQIAEYAATKDINWSKTVYQDAKSFFESTKLSELLDIYDIINGNDFVSCSEITKRYALGLRIPGKYRNIFNGIERNSYIRVYEDFTSIEQDNILVDIEKVKDTNKTILCFVDDQLGLNKRAKEIIEFFRSTFGINNRPNIVFVLFSSMDNLKDLVISDESMFIEYVNKNDSEDRVKTALCRSMSNLMLYKLKKIQIESLHKSFDKLLSNKFIPFYLSEKARKEGTTNCDFISNWITLHNRMAIEQSNEMESIIRLSRIMNLINEELVNFEDIETHVDLNSFEIFDHTVNKYHLPPAAGDIYDICGKLYVLVGQDCDLVIRNNKRKNSQAELVEARSIEAVVFEKASRSMEKIYFTNFRISPHSESTYLEIDCTKRYLIDHEILDLCTTNQNGNSFIALDTPPDVQTLFLMPESWDDYYQLLQDIFRNLVNLKSKFILGENEITWEGVAEAFGCNCSSKLLNIGSFHSINNNITFPVKRICRIKGDYNSLVFKLYLEYRGRQAFNPIWLSNIIEFQFTLFHKDVEIGKYTANAIMSTKNPKNGDLQKLDWYLSPELLQKILTDCCILINIPELRHLILKQSKSKYTLADKQLTITKNSFTDINGHYQYLIRIEQ